MRIKRKARTAVVEGLPQTRATVWDSVARGELALDFSTSSSDGEVLRRWGTKDKAGVKQAIIRWLDEQL